MNQKISLPILAVLSGLIALPLASAHAGLPSLGSQTLTALEKLHGSAPENAGSRIDGAPLLASGDVSGSENRSASSTVALKKIGSGSGDNLAKPSIPRVQDQRKKSKSEANSEGHLVWVVLGVWAAVIIAGAAFIATAPPVAVVSGALGIMAAASLLALGLYSAITSSLQDNNNG